MASNPLNVTASPQTTVRLSAWSDIADDVGNQIYLVVNGTRISEPQYVNVSRWSGSPPQDLTFTFDTPSEVQSIAIEFANDMVGGVNRSLYITGLNVNGTALTASEATLVTPWGNTGGTWDVWYNAKLTYDMTGRQDIFGPAPGGGTGGGGTSPPGNGGSGTPPAGNNGDQIFTWEGISLPSYWGGRFQTEGAKAALDQIEATGANTVTLVPNFFMKDQYSNEVKLNLSADPNTPWASESDTFAQVKQGILDAAAQGLKVVLKPHVETDNRVWRAEIAPTNPDLWFQSYKAMMVEYAKVAQEAGASMFVIGTEMKSMTVAQYTDEWVDIIDAVRTVYKGPITYSSTDTEAAQIQFWDKVDYIGINAYFPMTTSNSPSLQQLIDAWIMPSTVGYTNQIHNGLSTIDYYKSIAEKWGKKVIFTEVGYQSADGANKDPGAVANSGVVDHQEQKDLYEALYYVMEHYGGQWLDGAFLWSYHPFANPEADAGLAPTDYTTQGKPANAVITESYSGPAHEMGLVWNGTAGADKLNGGYHNDTLSGGAGTDTLWGGAGHDLLSGGAGADRFEFGFGSGQDTIQDFETAQANEVIALAKNLNGQTLASYEQLMARATTAGSDTILDLGSGNTLKLAGIAKAQLSANDFLFV